MGHWLGNLSVVFGPNAKIVLSADTLRSVRLRVAVERNGQLYEIEKESTWQDFEVSATDPLAMLAEKIISEWRSAGNH